MNAAREALKRAVANGKPIDWDVIAPLSPLRTWRSMMVARGLRTKRNNSPAFRRADLAKRAMARRKRFERIGEAWFACGSIERAAAAYASALNSTRRAHLLMGVAS